MRSTIDSSSLFLRVLPLLAGVALLAACGSSSSGDDTQPFDPSIVNANQIGTNWLENDTREGGTVGIVDASVIAPIFGTGVLKITTTDSTMGGSSAAKAQLFSYYNASQGVPGEGTLLSDITELGYWCRRDSASTNSAAQTIGLNIEVDFVGDGSSYTTLVFEPIYNVYQQAMAEDQWQYWDAFDGGNAIWWSSKDIPGVCAFSCFVTWNDILAANPNARIVWGLGFSCGSGWAGDFCGWADGLAVGVGGETTVYDFEQ